MYKHLTKGDRACIARLLRSKESHTYIALVIGVHRTTITREIKRNGTGHVYRSVCAHQKAKHRRCFAKVKYRIIDTNNELRKNILKHLKKRLSPEQIEGRYISVSFMTIYRYVRRNAHLKVHLRRKGKKRRRYGTRRIPSRYQVFKRSIHERLILKGFGHWEGDTIVGKERKWSIVTHVDKKSGFLLADLIEHSADEVHERVCSSMRRLPCHTITYDNGSEFALHRMIERDTGATVYFADAGHPEQRGCNENTNGLIRDYLPKGTSFASITNKDVQRIVRDLNDRRRKRLNYLTPREVFKKGWVHFKG